MLRFAQTCHWAGYSRVYWKLFNWTTRWIFSSVPMPDRDRDVFHDKIQSEWRSRYSALCLNKSFMLEANRHLSDPAATFNQFHGELRIRFHQMLSAHPNLGAFYRKSFASFHC